MKETALYARVSTTKGARTLKCNFVSGAVELTDTLGM
jgi:hypothetical protein